MRSNNPLTVVQTVSITCGPSHIHMVLDYHPNQMRQLASAHQSGPRSLKNTVGASDPDLLDPDSWA